jgi:hypothetical protein
MLLLGRRRRWTLPQVMAFASVAACTTPESDSPEPTHAVGDGGNAAPTTPPEAGAIPSHTAGGDAGVATDAATPGAPSSPDSGLGSDAGVPGQANPGACKTFESSFSAIQAVIFEGHGCTASACHGEAKSGGLDLRADVSYAQLINVKSSNSKLSRVQPGTATDSFLFEKLAAATNPGSVKTTGSPMPVGTAALSAKELEAVRLWILKSAPMAGNVKDELTGEDIGSLLDACLPPAKPIKATPLAPPPTSEGIQFVMPNYPLKAGVEVEQCKPFAYDFTDKVPAEFKDVSRNVMFVNGTRVLQDPSSHHMVVWNPSKALTTVPAGGWSCHGGANQGKACTGSSVECGAESICAGPAVPGTLCDIDTQSIASNTANPFESIWAIGSLLLGGLPAQVANTQSPQEYVPPFEGGVYSEIPLKGVLWFNSHAFNLTTEDTVLDARVNFYYAKERKRQMVPTNVVKNEVPNGLAPFTKKVFCSKAVVPRNYSIAMMTGHTHRHGERFWAKDATGKQIYESFVYNDPIYTHYEPWLEYPQADEASRTIEFCAEFNNGVKKDGSPDPQTVTRKSRMPPPNATCTPVACTAGKVGAACRSNADCDSAPAKQDGECDACPITSGLTTENEMFVLMPWYVMPAK